MITVTFTAIAITTIPMGCEIGSSIDGERFLPSEIEELASNRGPRDRKAESQEHGQAVYNHYCAICHGDKGDGNGFNASQLTQKPRNFTDNEFWKSVSRERTIQAISGGGNAVGKSVLMPAWGNTLSQMQIADLVAYIETFPESLGEQAKEPKEK